MSILYRFEIQEKFGQMGIYQVLSPWIITDYLQNLDLLPCPNLYVNKTVVFFFTEEGLKKCACCLEEIFTCNELIDYFQDNEFILMGLRILRPEWEPIYEDKFQICYDYKSISDFLNFKPLRSLEEWNRFISFSI